jgi:hypothetical protein
MCYGLIEERTAMSTPVHCPPGQDHVQADVADPDPSTVRHLTLEWVPSIYNQWC